MTSTANNNNNIDLQSWWEVPSIAHFCSLFRVAFNLLDFDIEELEEALLTDGTELNGSSLLQELIVRLLAGCLGHNGISTFNYQMFLRRLFRSKCKEQGRDNPFNTDIDFQFLPLRTKVEILHALCDFRLDADDVIDVLKNLDSDSLRVHPLGYDDDKSAYWYFYGTRLYREDYPKKKRRKRESHDRAKSKKKKKERRNSEDNDEEEDENDESNASYEENGNDSDVTDDDWGTLGLGTWQVMCYTEEDWQNLADSMAGSSCKEERALFQVLSEDFLPEIPRLFEEKERLQRKRMMENQPRRQSQRLEKLKSQKDVPQVTSDKEKDKAVSSPSSPKQKKEPSGRRKRGRGRTAATKRNNSASRSLSSLRSSSTDSERSLIPSSGRRTNNSLSSAAGEVMMKGNNYVAGSKEKYQSTPLWRRTREDLMTGLYKILDRVKAHKDAWPFLDPVDETYAPRYYAVIARPMDLQKMEDKLDNGEYGSLQQFRADFQLIVDNCRQYNGSANEYTEMVLRLRALFDACAERFLEADEASSDSDAPPLLHRPLSDGFDDDDDVDSLGSSFTPVNGPNSLSDRSRTRSLTSLSEGSVIMSEDEIDDDHDSDNTYDPRRPKEAPRRGPGTGMRGRPPRSPVAHASRARHRRKRRRRKRKGSEARGVGGGRPSGGRGKSTSSSRSNSRKPGPKPKPPPPPPPPLPVEESTSTPGDQPLPPVPNKPKRGRPANSGKNQLKQLQQQQQQDQQPPPPPRKSPSPESFDRERQRRRVNYKEEDTTDSDDLLSSHSSATSTTGSTSSFINHKPHGRGRPPAHSQIIGPKKPVKRAGVIKNMEAIEQLELATEQTLKDINRWLDDTPRFSDFSSNSNSPLHVPSYVVEEMATIEGEYKKRLQQAQNNRPRDRFSNDLHRRKMYKEQIGLKRKREIQRTIDRLQPGKSKGNLLSKDRNSTVAGTNPATGPTGGAGDDAAANSETKPLVLGAISLGKVLENDLLGLGGGDSASSAQPIKSSDDDATGDKLVIEEDVASGEANEDKKKNGTTTADVDKNGEGVREVKEEVKKEEAKKEKPTPNLSAWFKAFGAPKTQSAVKKKPEPDPVKEKPAPILASVETTKEDELGPNSPLMPARRQRKTSTGSSVSERSSFSQEPGDGQSPRSEPYLSPQQSNPQATPLHHPQHHYPPTGPASPINGAIKVGFYQDTGACVSPATSPYGHSPVGAGNPPQPPYGYHYPEHDHMGRREYGGPPMSPRPASRTPTPLDEYHSPPPRAPSVASGYPSPTSPRSPVHPSLYAHGGGVPSYPSHLSYYEHTAAASAYREKPPPVYPVKKRYNTAAAAVNNAMNNNAGGFADVDNTKGGSFTPTREAMEHERTFTPTPGRMPIAHHHPLLMDHRHLMEQYYQGGGGGPPTTPQPPNQPPSAPSSPAPVVSVASPSHVPLNFATARSPPSSRSPLNYSQSEIPHQEPVGRPPMHHPEDASKEAALAAAAYRLSEMLPGKPPFHHPINYPSPNEELSKLYGNPELHQRLNYSHQMADLSQQMARYSFHELMTGKGPPPVYNHPSPGSYSNIIPPQPSTYPSRPLAEMMQANQPATKLEPVNVVPPQPPIKPKRGRKKKNEVPPPAPVIQPTEPPQSSFQQWHSSGGYLDQQPPSMSVPNNRVDSHRPTHVPSPTVNHSNSMTQPGTAPPQSYFPASSGATPGRPPTGPTGYPPPPATHHFIPPPPHHPHAQYHPHMVLLPPPHAHPHGAPPYPPPPHPSSAAYHHLAAMHHDPINRPSWL